MSTLTSAKKVGDIVRFEVDGGMGYCREYRTVLDGQDFSIGEVGYLNSDSKMVACGAGVAEVQTLTLSAGTDGGSFKLIYKELVTAALAWNVSAADMQVALRALHADLAACTVDLTSEVYTITVPATSIPIGGIPLIQVLCDITTDGAAAEGGVTPGRTTTGNAVGLNAEAVCLEASAPSGADGYAMFLVRGPAICDIGQMTYPTGGSTGVIAALKTKGILCLAEPTKYTAQAS
jgi:hypothetical protein